MSVTGKQPCPACKSGKVLRPSFVDSGRDIPRTCSVCSGRGWIYLSKEDLLEIIAALESKLAEANAGLNNMAKRLCLNHAATMCGDRYQRNDGKCEICEMQAKMAACEWKPITETDLPKDGDEVIKAIPGDGWAIEIEAVNLSRTRINPTSKFYLRYGKTHFRAINPPQQGKP